MLLISLKIAHSLIMINVQYYSIKQYKILLLNGSQRLVTKCYCFTRNCLLLLFERSQLLQTCESYFLSIGINKSVTIQQATQLIEFKVFTR